VQRGCCAPLPRRRPTPAHLGAAPSSCCAAAP
jgi:hypothetical protein